MERAGRPLGPRRFGKWSPVGRGDPESLVFPAFDGREYADTPTTFRDAVEALGFNQGITDPRQKVVFHALRHSYASWLAEAGTDIYTVGKLLGHIRAALKILIREMEFRGPIRGNWPNYGRLGRDRHHCHLKRRHPTFVAVWEVLDNEVRLIEVTYAGTHEKAPY